MDDQAFILYLVQEIQGFSAQESPVLLLLDGHRSHTKSLQLMNNASENGVIMLYFTPHCTHRLSIGLHLIQHHMTSVAPAKIQKEMTYLVVGLQLKNI
jgi:tyrosine-protein phosphatase YwqE